MSQQSIVTYLVLSAFLRISTPPFLRVFRSIFLLLSITPPRSRGSVNVFSTCSVTSLLCIQAAPNHRNIKVKGKTTEKTVKEREDALSSKSSASLCANEGDLRGRRSRVDLPSFAERRQRSSRCNREISLLLFSAFLTSSIKPHNRVPVRAVIRGYMKRLREGLTSLPPGIDVSPANVHSTT